MPLFQDRQDAFLQGIEGRVGAPARAFDLHRELGADAPRPPRKGTGWIYAVDSSMSRPLWKADSDDRGDSFPDYWGIRGLVPVDGGVVFATAYKVVKLKTPPRAP